MGKRLGLLGAVIAVMALVVGQPSGVGILESGGGVDRIRPHRQTPDDPRDCRVHRV